jgi:hypothetical protein
MLNHIVMIQAGVIGTHHYNRWREKGQAFEIREGAYDVANRTLASGAVFNVVCFLGCF